MVNPSNSFRVVAQLSPDEICRAELKVAYYPGPNNEISSIRMAFWHLEQEGRLQWIIRVIEGAKHLAALTADWTPDILVTHWHGEYTSSASRSIPAEITHRLRSARGSRCVSDGPFLVAQVSAGDTRFSGGHYDDYGLHELYDMVIQRPQNLDRFPRNLAVGIYNSTHPSAPAMFDPDFRVLSEQSKVR
jgi:hypothetical protein